MRNRLARMLRRTANKLDPPKPVVINCYNTTSARDMREAMEASRRLTEQAFRYVDRL